MFNFLPGKKTYIGGWLMIISAVAQFGRFVAGEPDIDPSAAWMLLLGGWTAIGLRKGMPS